MSPTIPTRTWIQVHTTEVGKSYLVFIMSMILI